MKAIYLPVEDRRPLDGHSLESLRLCRGETLLWHHLYFTSATLQAAAHCSSAG